MMKYLMLSRLGCFIATRINCHSLKDKTFAFALSKLSCLLQIKSSRKIKLIISFSLGFTYPKFSVIVNLLSLLKNFLRFQIFIHRRNILIISLHQMFNTMFYLFHSLLKCLFIFINKYRIELVDYCLSQTYCI